MWCLINPLAVVPCRILGCTSAVLLSSVVAERRPGTVLRGMERFDVGASQARQVVAYPTRERPGTITVDPGSHFLYFIHDAGQAIRYGVGVGAEGFVWSGRATVQNKQEWPDWYPPAEMLARKPELRQHMVQLQSGIGMKGGPDPRGPCICGRATRTRYTASTAPMSPGPLAPTSRPAAFA